MWPRRIKPGFKACFDKGWQTSDPDLHPGILERWLAGSDNFGIGLLMGSPICEETTLGALDVDRNEYVELAKTLLRNPVCGRIGSKGAVFFVRVLGDLKNPEFRVRGENGKKWGKVAECLFRRKLCVIPPTVHPTTRKPYEWIGAPLHEIDLLSLPIIGE
jgi:hypothetical protein